MEKKTNNNVFTTSVYGEEVFKQRYAARDSTGKIIETRPEQMFRRVAKALASVEKNFNSTAPTKYWENVFYEEMVEKRFCPAGRTLRNAGTRNIVSNCIVLHVEDTMESILQAQYDMAMLQRYGSGLGVPLHLMRPAGIYTSKSGGVSSGPNAFLRMFNGTFSTIKQQNRHGANMAVMRVDHPEVLDFIHCKDKEGDLRCFNVSVGLTDEFLKQVQTQLDDVELMKRFPSKAKPKWEPKPWMCSWNDEPMAPYRIELDEYGAFKKRIPKTMTALELFREMCQCSWNTGEPGFLFMDTVNSTNPLPTLGRLECCNPCGEQFLHDGDVCNLGAINLEAFFIPEPDRGTWAPKVHWIDYIDREKLCQTVHIAVRMLDNVIDLTDFCVERVNKTCRANRRIGLGIFGLADLLFLLKIGYNTGKGREVAGTLFAIIQKEAIIASLQLGIDRGLFPNAEHAVGETKNCRNLALTTVAPTGTISALYNISGGIEPYFALCYDCRNVLNGLSNLGVDLHPALLDALKSEGLTNNTKLLKRIRMTGSVQSESLIPQWIKDVFVTSMDISAVDHILMQSCVQKHCSNSISKTINLPNDATVKDIENVVMLAWKKECKGMTVYRDNSRNVQVLNRKEDTKKRLESEAKETKGQDCYGGQICTRCNE